jgi:uncharacterized membrane protein
MMFSRRSPRPLDESGVILPLTVVLMAATVTIASLVIDVGGDRVVRQDMQSVADVVALDFARNLDGRTANGYTGFSSSGPSTTLFASQKSTSLSRQSGLLSSPDSVTARLAVANQDTGTFLHWAAAGEVPNAVRVWSTGSSAFRIFPTKTALTPDGYSHNLQRSALAVIGRPLICLSAGATLADLTPGGTLDIFLGKLIGINQLSLVSPTGVANLSALVPLGQLATQLNVGSVDQLATANVSGQSFLVAAATVLSNNGNNAAATVLNAIAAKVSGAAMNVSQILNLNTGAGSAANLNIDAFSLAQAVIEVSNKNNFVDLAVPVGITGLASVTLKAKVIEAPQIACGPVGTKAKSSQVQISLTADVLGSLLAGLVASAKINDLLVTAGNGAGTVSSITCAPNGSTLGVSADTSVGTLKLHLLTTLLLGIIKLAIDVPDPATNPNGSAIGTSTSVPLTFSFPAGSTSVPAAQTAGTGMTSLGLSSITPKVTVTAGLVLNLSSLISGTVVPLLGVVDGVVSPLLTSVLGSLGIRLGTVEIQPTTIPACNEPQLRD